MTAKMTKGAVRTAMMGGASDGLPPCRPSRKIR